MKRFVVGRFYEAEIDAATRIHAVFNGCGHEHATLDEAKSCNSDGEIIFDRDSKKGGL